MKQLSAILFILLLGAADLYAQSSPEVYRLYDAKGHPVTFATMVADLAQQDVVLVGEMHNCPVNHWMELVLLKALHRQNGASQAVGMEMLESDCQLLVDEYLQGAITSERFEDECRLWPNYSTDYESLVEYAREHHLRLAATNVPRRYANVVKNHGLARLDSLSPEARSYMAPLPLSVEENTTDSEAFGMMSLMGKGKSNPRYMTESQALKDATMAWNIARMRDHRTVHFNGNYHSDNHEGIVTYLRRYWPQVRLKTICSVRQEDISRMNPDNLGRADYYLCITEDMVTTY